MTKIALINNLHVDHLGFYYISAVARQHGWDVRLFLTDRSIERNLANYQPDVVCFTATTGNHGWVLELCRELRPRFPRARFVLGGPHPTYYPEVIRTGLFDAVARGEGEETIVDLVERFAAGESIRDVQGAWAWEEGEVHENPLREAPQSLDAIPFADRSLYDDYPWLLAHRYPMMITSRGCPFSCTFCYSPTMMRMNKGLGKFVRFRSVDNVIAEAIELKRRYNPTIIEFVDDIFGMHRPWLREFSDKWRQHVGLPFNMCVRADLIDEETAELYARAGANAVNVGLEAGNDRIRNEVLQKELSRERLFQAAELMRRHGMRFVTLNIMGSPGETMEDCLETIELNQQLKPDYSHCSLLIPFPRTAIYDTAVAAGQIEDDIPVDRFNFSFFQRSPLIRDDLGGITNLQRVFNLVVQFPWLMPVARWVAKRREIPALYVFFLTSHFFLYYMRVKKVQWYYLLRLGMNMKELVRRHRAGVYAKLLPRDPDRPESQPPASSPPASTAEPQAGAA